MSDMSELQAIALILAIIAVAIIAHIVLQLVRSHKRRHPPMDNVHDLYMPTVSTPIVRRPLPAWTADPTAYGDEFAEIAGDMPDLDATFCVIAFGTDEESEDTQ